MKLIEAKHHDTVASTLCVLHRSSADSNTLHRRHLTSGHDFQHDLLSLLIGTEHFRFLHYSLLAALSKTLEKQWEFLDVRISKLCDSASKRLHQY